MKQFEFPIRTIVNGLRRSPRSVEGPMGLVECMNTKPHLSDRVLNLRKLIPHESFTNPFSGLTIAFPYPQLFRGREVTLLADSDKVYTVDESDWTKTELTLYEYDNTDVEDAVVAGGPWHFMDFGNSWILLNGSCQVFKANTALVGGVDKYLLQDDITIQTGCVHRGRSILAGFDSTNFWSSTWTTNLQALMSRLPSGWSKDIDVGSNFVMYSSIGGGAGDLYWLLYPDVAQSGFLSGGGFSNSRPKWLEDLTSGEMGLIPMPTQGTVRCVKSLGMNVIAYTDSCVVALTLKQDRYYAPSMYSPDVLLDVGIASRSAVAGDDKQHAFVDTTGAVWHVDGSLKLTRLGYEEWFQTAIDNGNYIVGCYDPEHREFYFSDEDAGYVLTEGGLGQVSELPTSLYRIDGLLKGVFEAKGDTSWRVTTEEFDFGIRALKTIDSVEVVGSSKVPMETAIDFRYAGEDAYRSTEWVKVNKEGISQRPITALEFRVKVRGSPYSELDIDYIIVRWKLVDKRGIRGEYVNPPTARTGAQKLERYL